MPSLNPNLSKPTGMHCFSLIDINKYEEIQGSNENPVKQSVVYNPRMDHWYWKQRPTRKICSGIQEVRSHAGTQENEEANAVIEVTDNISNKWESESSADFLRP